MESITPCPSLEIPNVIFDLDEMKINVNYRVKYCRGYWKIIRIDPTTVVLTQLDLRRDEDVKLVKELPEVPINKQVTRID